ncbi:hypothetical protein FIBSPDRAFT_861848 [Athelia psychrophila]|uniref:Uncharacterized protein n=1 Tax=Athelia psychrophila TaxID=1759441 RepID=A0A166IYZ9_9AGAM|nr:hypothetical protein FIBSPDRAFT_861848 [Fibularhizoctonia sp. CBS 109695]
MAPKSDSLSVHANSSLQPPRSPRGAPAALAGRRPSGGQVRKQGAQWNDREDIDDGQDEALEVSGDEDPAQEPSPSGGQVVDLRDAARVVPAKVRGIAREFEVVQGSPRVIALDDEPAGPAPTEEDWENVDAGDVEQRKTYSAVVSDRGSAPQ